MSEFINFINGKWEKKSNSNVPIHDAGFLLGDGLFETIRFDNKNLFQVDKHINRLLDGLKIIRINLNKSIEDIIFLLEKIILKNKLESGLLRLMITRGEIEGTPWTYQGLPGIYITIRNFSPEPEYPVKVVFYSERKYPIIRFKPAIKSLNYIGNMLAKKDAGNEGAYEPIFYNNEKIITECAIRNVFFIKDDNLLTPNINLGVLPGVMRETIIEIAKTNNLKVKQTSIDMNSIHNMDEAFISSTGIGLLPCYWDNWKSNYKITLQLKKDLNLAIKKGL